MKKLLVSALALSTLAGGMSAASAAVETFMLYNLNFTFTNPEMTVWRVNSGPQTTSGAASSINSDLSLNTDGSGKISGSGWMFINYGTNAGFSQVIVDVTGRIGSTATKPVSVSLQIHGSGYTSDGVGGGSGLQANFKFTGAPGTNPDNTNSTVIIGTLTGDLRGKTPLAAKDAKVSETATLGSDSSIPNISADVLQSTRRMIVFESDPFAGVGTIHLADYKFTVKGTGRDSGGSIGVSGTLTSYTNNVGTNPVVFLAPSGGNAKGKVNGQVISGTAATTTANLISD
jgi:hypothetical protein